MTSNTRLPVGRVVDLSLVPRRNRQDFWRTVAAPNFDMTELPDEMTAQADIYFIGPITLSRSRHPQQTLTRTATRARADGDDNILCSMELSTGFTGLAGDSALDVGVGRISLWDLGRASTKRGHAGETLCMKIDRDAWRGIAGGDPAVHGMTLDAMGPLFRDHLLSLERTLAANPDHATPALGVATLQLLAACVQPQRLRKPEPPVSELGVFRAERYIKANLSDPELAPERIARALNISRSGLYSLFERSGGVAARIRILRLERAHAMLVKPEERRIGDVAFAVGFSGASQFNRAFKAHYGYPPGDIRQTG